MGTGFEQFATLRPGVQALIPPWDYGWALPNDSNPFVYGVSFDEQMLVECHGGLDAASGYGISGSAVFLSSPVQRPVSIRPFVPSQVGYHFKSLAFNGNTRGGYAVLMTDGSGNAILNTTWWSEVWDRTFNNDDQIHVDAEGYVQDCLPNEAIASTMNANETYGIWLSIWGHADQSGSRFTDILGDDYGSWCDFSFAASLLWIVVV